MSRQGARPEPMARAFAPGLVRAQGQALGCSLCYLLGVKGISWLIVRRVPSYQTNGTEQMLLRGNRLRLTRMALFFFFVLPILTLLVAAQNPPAVDPSVPPPPHEKQIR